MKNLIWAGALLVVAVALFFVYQDNVKLRNSLDLIDQAVSTSTLLTDTVRNNKPTTEDTMTGDTLTGDMSGAMDASVDVMLTGTSAE